MLQPDSIRRWLNWISVLLALVGVGFVTVKIANHATEIKLTSMASSQWAALGILALMYAASNTLLARAWWLVLQELYLKMPWQLALRLYGVSQINKYVPGNIMHLAGRQALGMAAGFKARPLALSSLWELGLLSIAALCCSVLSISLIWPNFSLPITATAWALLLIVLRIALSRFGFQHMTMAVWWQTGFLLLSGATFATTLLVVTNGSPGFSPAMLPAVCGAYIVAWLAGMVTPGAPAGVGIREAVLLLLLGHFVPPADLLLAVVSGRAVTAAGDLFFYIYASSIQSKQHDK